jgi:ferredoxin
LRPSSSSAIQRSPSTGARCGPRRDEVFDQHDEDGIVVLLTDNPPEELAADIHQAAAVCPALAIVVED